MLPLRRSVILLTILPFLAACSSVVQVGTVPSQSSVAPIELTQAGILAAINSTRAAYGKPPLHYSTQLEAAARTQVNLMVAKDQISHNLGLTLRQRVTNAGYDGAVGENVAAGQRTLDQAIQGWLASPAHRDTLLSTKFQDFGLAVATTPGDRKSRYKVFWAFVAGGPQSAWF